MTKYERVGGGQFGVYRPKKTEWGAILGGIVVGIIAIVVIANL